MLSHVLRALGALIPWETPVRGGQTLFVLNVRGGGGTAASDVALKRMEIFFKASEDEDASRGNGSPLMLS